MILLSINIQDLVFIFSNENVIEFFFRLFVNSFFVFVLIRFVYIPRNSQPENLFIFSQMGLLVFFMASILEHVKLDFGFAIGLFAIFSIIRFRTPPMEFKEVTYLFSVIGLSIINALVAYEVADWIGLLISNIIIVGSAYILEEYKPRKLAVKKALTFKPSGLYILKSNKLLIDEIKARTSIDVTKVEITRINSAKGEVTVWIYFKMSD